MPNENKADLLFVEFKDMETKEVTVEGEKYYEFEGYGATFGNIDLGNDICAKGCFEKSLKKRMPKILWQHNWNEPVGVYIEAKETEIGLMVKGRMPMSDSLVSERIVPQMKVGSVDSLSIGFFIVEAVWNNETEIRTIIEADLLEISPVTFPMNPLARIQAQKEFKAMYESKQMTSEVMKTDFAIADIEYKWNPEEAKKRIEGKGLPELPVFDVINEKAVVVPRAMFALKAQLIGARGGYDGDEVVAKEFLNKYYEKMNLEAPFIGTAAFCETEINNLQKSELSYILRNGKLSKSCADSVAGKVLATDTKPDETGNEKAIKSISDDIKKRTQKLNTK